MIIDIYTPRETRIVKAEHIGLIKRAEIKGKSRFGRVRVIYLKANFEFGQGKALPISPTITRELYQNEFLLDVSRGSSSESGSHHELRIFNVFKLA